MADLESLRPRIDLKLSPDRKTIIHLNIRFPISDNGAICEPLFNVGNGMASTPPPPLTAPSQIQRSVANRRESSLAAVAPFAEGDWIQSLSKAKPHPQSTACNTDQEQRWSPPRATAGTAPRDRGGAASDPSFDHRRTDCHSPLEPRSRCATLPGLPPERVEPAKRGSCTEPEAEPARERRGGSAKARMLSLSRGTRSPPLPAQSTHTLVHHNKTSTLFNSITSLTKIRTPSHFPRQRALPAPVNQQQRCACQPSHSRSSTLKTEWKHN